MKLHEACYTGNPKLCKLMGIESADYMRFDTLPLNASFSILGDGSQVKVYEFRLDKLELGKPTLGFNHSITLENITVRLINRKDIDFIVGWNVLKYLQTRKNESCWMSATYVVGTEINVGNEGRWGGSMRKILCALFTVCLVAALAACGGNDTVEAIDIFGDVTTSNRIIANNALRIVDRLIDANITAQTAHSLIVNLNRINDFGASDRELDMLLLSLRGAVSDLEFFDTTENRNTVLEIRNELAMGLGSDIRYIDEFQDVEIEIASVAINADIRAVLQYHQDRATGARSDAELAGAWAVFMVNVRLYTGVERQTYYFAMFGGEAFLARFDERNFEEIREFLQELHSEMGLTFDFESP